MSEELAPGEEMGRARKGRHDEMTRYYRWGDRQLQHQHAPKLLQQRNQQHHSKREPPIIYMNQAILSRTIVV
jgi:hypothetical protein